MLTNWTELKGKSKWVNIEFNDSENPALAKHFTFAFETTNLIDLLNFEFSLLDDEARPIKFAATEQKKNTSTDIYNLSNQIKC